MSAVNSSIREREDDALRRAQRAHEPSMEEILASIRTIIAEEREPAEPLSETRAPSAKAAPAPVAPQVVYSRNEPPSRAEVPRAEAVAEPIPPKAAEREPEPAPQTDRPEEPLLSSETDEAVASAFEALSASLAARSAEIAEEMAREMLRPMLKAWLDENLSGIVERLVRAEIERVVRAPR